MTDSSAAALVHHREFYIPGADVIFLVENTLFRVHKYFFERESVVMRKLLAQPATPGQARPGSSDSNALYLDVQSDDFSKLLWVFYNPKYSLYSKANTSDWVKILRLAHRWEFAEVKSLAARELNKLDMPPIQRITLYQDHELNRSTLIDAYTSVCRRKENPFISDDEGNALGMKTVLRLCQVRETLLRTPAVEAEALVMSTFGLSEPPPPEEGTGPPRSPTEETTSSPTAANGASVDPAAAATAATATGTTKNGSPAPPPKGPASSFVTGGPSDATTVVNDPDNIPLSSFRPDTPSGAGDDDPAKKGRGSSNTTVNVAAAPNKKAPRNK